MTHPGLFSDPVQREYQSLQSGQKFKDLRQVPVLRKDSPDADCTSFPARTGFADLIALFKEPKSGEPAWITATNQDGGYMWFSLKDPAVLPATVFWIENHGRHAEPWNGRNRCLGLEDVCGYFAEGIVPSTKPNAITEAGFATAIELTKDRPTVVNYIQGVARIPEGFEMVKTVQFAPGRVTFVSTTGKKVTVPVRHEFLKNGKL
jgi:hypothetical protein